ncbi:MAG TPA: 4-hydroxy-tetrahydrodipicolinate reductase [Nitrospiraceae bacterium]|jgi:4-hydroxy-tetrahydrodipicolinate reductase|nr:4-hydroxy-tetrahydrodipicolinate reductase [Nitrospiraceae bacterium]
MINVIVAGAAGRMGCRLVALIKESTTLTLAGAVEGKGHQAVGDDAGEIAGCGHAGIPITDDVTALLDRGEVVVDFSAPEATLHHLRAVAQHRRAMVIGTTGFSAPQLEELKSLACRIPCVLSPNMSVGVNLIYKVIGEMAKTLGDEYDIEVIEAHHRLKKDAPSGTALKISEVLAKAMNRDLNQVGVYARKGLIGERKKGEIGIQTIRAGDIVGDHTILFGGMGERIEVTHRASSRDTFAGGALRAVRWVVRQSPGLYDMMDVLSLR